MPWEKENRKEHYRTVHRICQQTHTCERDGRNKLLLLYKASLSVTQVFCDATPHDTPASEDWEIVSPLVGLIVNIPVMRGLLVDSIQGRRLWLFRPPLVSSRTLTNKLISQVVESAVNIHTNTPACTNQYIYLYSPWTFMLRGQTFQKVILKQICIYMTYIYIYIYMWVCDICIYIYIYIYSILYISNHCIWKQRWSSQGECIHWL